MELGVHSGRNLRWIFDLNRCGWDLFSSHYYPQNDLGFMEKGAMVIFAAVRKAANIFRSR